MSRIEFTTKTKVKRLAFAEFKCEGVVAMDDGSRLRCNATLAQGRVEFDHDLAAELGGDASFGNCRALLSKVAEIIGNKSWSYISCDGCGDHVDEAVTIGEYEPKHNYCKSCILEAKEVLSP